VAAAIRFTLAPSEPFRLDLTAWALRRRAHNGVDRWDGAAYRRALPCGAGAIGLAVSQEGDPGAPRLAVTLAGGAGGRRRGEALAREALTKVLGLEVDLSGFAAMAARDPALAGLAERLCGLRPPRFPTVFEGLVNGIACQQLSLDVGIHLLTRLTAAHGRPVGADPDGPRAFPGPAVLAPADPAALKGLGFSRAKAEAIVGAARAALDGSLDLEALAELEDGAALERLTSLRGVGRWTAEYVLLRGLGRLHVFPGDDVGARNKLKSFLGIEGELGYADVASLTAAWRPYAGVVYFHLLLDSLSRAGAVAA
jgi:DNA-3-methyladenine glycosylase II